MTKSLRKPTEKIPRKIHYVWVGINPLPPADAKRIKHWRKLHPDFEIKLWNEKNFDIDSNYWTREAYRAKNYALVSDVIRIYALMHEGGIYLDTDLELLRPLDDLLQYKGFLSFDSSRWANSAIIGSTPNSAWIKKVWRRYDGTHGTINMSANLKTVQCLSIFAHDIYGIKLNGQTQEKDGFAIFERHVMAPKHFITGKMEITDKTRAIHHFAKSWHDTIWKRASVKAVFLLYKILGARLAAVLIENPTLLYYKIIFRLEDKKLSRKGAPVGK